LRDSQFKVLLKLAEQGAYLAPIQISTTDIAAKISISQQTASRYLVELEKNGHIQREMIARGEMVKLTQKGQDELRKVCDTLRSIIEPASQSFVLEGYLVTGMGEGGYYLGQRGYRRQIVKMLGFDPFPGTLNLKMRSSLETEARKQLDNFSGLIIEGFGDGSRTFGSLKCFRALINGKIQGAVILIERSHHDKSILEVLAPMDLRRQLGLRDGDKVRIRVFI
jgi:riboflavin kinase